MCPCDKTKDKINNCDYTFNLNNKNNNNIICQKNDTNCVICMENFDITNKQIKVGKLDCCDHLFHYDCILTWLVTETNSCPLCKKKVTELIYVNPPINFNGTKIKKIKNKSIIPIDRQKYNIYNYLNTGKNNKYKNYLHKIVYLNSTLNINEYNKLYHYILYELYLREEWRENNKIILKEEVKKNALIMRERLKNFLKEIKTNELIEYNKIIPNIILKN